MTLEKAFSYIIEKEGIGIIAEPRFANFLNDLQVFNSLATKRVIVTMIESDYFARLQFGLSEQNCELVFNNVRNDLVKNEGFQPDIVDYIINCLLYALHKTKSIPKQPNIDTTTTKIKNIPKNDGNPSNSNFSVVNVNDNYIVTFNGEEYELDKNQYKAIIRKKDMPANRLEVWLKSYAEKNK